MQDFRDESFATAGRFVVQPTVSVPQPDGAQRNTTEPWLRGGKNDAAGALALASYLSKEARERVTHLTIGWMDVNSEKKILKLLPNLSSVTIHCNKASGDLLALIAKSQAPRLKELVLTTVGGKLIPGQVLDLIAAAPNLTTLHLPGCLNLSRDILKLMKDKIALSRGSGGKSLVRELVVQSIDMAALHRLGEVFPEIERLGIFHAPMSWQATVRKNHPMI